VVRRRPGTQPDATEDLASAKVAAVHRSLRFALRAACVTRVAIAQAQAPWHHAAVCVTSRTTPDAACCSCLAASRAAA
jgi:hypothetical protein